jgi:hypothetical protein
MDIVLICYASFYVQVKGRDLTSEEQGELLYLNSGLEDTAEPCPYKNFRCMAEEERYRFFYIGFQA